MSSPERAPAAKDATLDERAMQLAREIAGKLASGEPAVSPEAIQSLMSALCRAYAAAQEAGHRFPILAQQDAATGTDVMVVCSALLKAADLQVFELGMWTSWTGR